MLIREKSRGRARDQRTVSYFHTQLRKLFIRSVLGLVLSGAGCVGSLSAPSAYQEQSYLCDASHAASFQALVDSCGHGARCAGVFSMTGRLEGTPLTFGGVLGSAQYFVVQMPMTTTRQWDQAKMSGASPYFDYIFHLVSIGGNVGENETKTRTLSINSHAPGLTNSLADTQVQAGQLLEVAGASDDILGITNSGSVVLTHLAADEAAGTFHGQFGDTSDVVDGCFDMFPTLALGVNPAPAP